MKGAAAMTQYDRDWTILGLVDVQEDIHLLPADRLRFREVSPGKFDIVVLKGDKAFWEQFKELKEVGSNDPVIASLPKADSVVLRDTGPYAAAVRAFNAGALNSARRLNQKLPVGPDVLELDVCVPQADDDPKREVLVVRIRHAAGGPLQNGTGHGDWT
jgi:hypothetical protein